jgi:ParB family transcriptional regulator, chromosome partitioning protein
LPSVVERGIGRGLAAILPIAEAGEESLERVPVDMIRPNPRQPRSSFGDDALAELAGSLKQHGLLQPVLVRPVAAGGYELVAGERRWRAAQLAQIERIPAIVRPADDAERLELALIENVAREDLNPVEVARACAALVEELNLTKEEVGRRIGKSRVAISNSIRLLDLPDEVLALLESGDLSEGHGRALLQAPGPQAQRALAREARDKQLSVRETEKRARTALAKSSGLPAGSRSRASTPDGDRADAERARIDAEEALSAALGMEVRVRLRRSGCSVELQLEDLDEAHELARSITRRLAA